MSDNENPASTPKTSSVPLKKETVRITLRARPGAGVTQPREATSPVAPGTVTGSVPTMTTSSIMPPTARRATAPIQLPSAPLPPPSPKASTAPVSLPPPPAAAVTTPRPSVPPRPSGPMAPPAPRPSAGAPPAARAPGAPPAPAPRAVGPPAGPPPTKPMGGPPSAAPAGVRTETGAMTAPLARGPAPARPTAPGGGAGTGPMSAGGATAALPKATTKLQQTQPIARAPLSAPASAPVKRAAAADSQQFYDDDKDPEAGLVGISIACLVVAVVLMSILMLGSDKVMPARPGEVSAILVPSDEKVAWESYNAVTGVWQNKFKEVLPTIPD